MNINDLKKKTILVLGASRTGISSATFLLQRADKILLSDNKEKKEEFESKINFLIKEGVETEFGKNSEEFIKRADLVIISPGISPKQDIVKKINSLNIPIISDIELASYFIKKPVIAITGTNGKTTTTSLISHIINSSGKKATSCGNIGNPLIEVINEDVDFFVLEMSSFQIYYSTAFNPDIAVCLNITPDHLDWHKDLNDYINSKEKLFRQQGPDTWSVLNLQDEIVKNFKTKNNIFYFSEKDINSLPANIAYFEEDILKLKTKNEIKNIATKKDLQIIGRHNIENALASIAACNILGLTDKNINQGLKTFQGIEHRLEPVRNINGKEFYNDSKATNPEATIKAIEAINEEKKGKPITLILGGRDKKTSLNEMIRLIKDHVDEVILYGEAMERFKSELNNNNYNNLKIVYNLPEAIKASLNSNTQVVLFSPACSSFDMFKNYEERGKIFKEIVSKI